MLTPKDITFAKAVSVVSYLQSVGHEPVKEQGGQLVYYSPFVQEQTPSFFVNPSKNVFNDFGSGQRGDVVRLVQILDGTGFVLAVGKLLAFEQTTPAFSFSGLKTSKTGQSDFKLVIDTVTPIRHTALLNYTDSRMIPTRIAQTYLKEFRYTLKGNQYFAVGFENDKGGFEIRNKVGTVEIKICSSPKGITTIHGPGGKTLNLFEGFFDFLSALVWFEVDAPQNTTIVLNSTSNLTATLIAQLKAYSKVNVYFDNDTGGNVAMERLERGGVNVSDCRDVYDGYKDFNAFAVSCK